MTLLDTRSLGHPEPLEMATEAFKNLTHGEIVHMIHTREPLPLFEILRNNGGNYRSDQTEDGIWHIFFTRDGNLETCHV